MIVKLFYDMLILFNSLYAHTVVTVSHNTMEKSPRITILSLIRVNEKLVQSRLHLPICPPATVEGETFCY